MQMHFELLLFVLVGCSVVLGFTQNPLLTHDNKLYRHHKDANGVRNAKEISRKCLVDSREYAQPHTKHSAQQPLDLNSLSFWEKISFTWAYPLMQKGNNNSKALEVSDLWLLDESLLMENSSENFESYFTNETTATAANMTSNNSEEQKTLNKNILLQFWMSPVTRALVKMYKQAFKNSGLLKLFNTLVQFLPSLLIAKILNIISESSKLKALGSSSIAMNSVYMRGHSLTHSLTYSLTHSLTQV